MNVAEREKKNKLDRNTDEENKEKAPKKEFGKKAGMIASLVAAGALAVGCGSSSGAAEDARTDRGSVRLDGYSQNDLVDEDMDAPDWDIEGDLTDVEVAPDVPEVTDAPGDTAGDIVTDAPDDTVEDGDVSEDLVDEDTVTDAPGDVTEEEDADLDAPGDTAGDIVTDAPDDTVEDGDVSEDLVDEDTVTDAPGDTVTDVSTDVATDLLDVGGEEIVLVCSPFDDIATGVWIDTGTDVTVGGVEVRYMGVDSVTGEGMYDIICGGVTVRESVLVPESGTTTVDILELGFRVIIDANSISDLGTNSDIEVISGLPILCVPFDDSRTIGLGVDASMTVGGVDVVYRGLDLSGDPTYDVYCGGILPLRTGITVAVGHSETVDVPEYGFTITLRPFSASFRNSSVTVTVDAYH